ncbi:DUF1476 domain-containing protein [Falsigemmobacter intermedius]|uniref:DUF1476 domain-containing protein n=1 Tax=Falsigemmobacter intermedius TaxID=1553448 RepID=A0A3S3WUM1_9RHOB|nr:DUF1476 domain-containing protein [Falsigemmobacter intermedius]RWY44414.1 DUF1476 domain-containing protein [Falsigemmobacter intermedius]
MTTFDDRERGFENKFAHDAEMQFKASARRNRLLAEWAAGILGKTGPEAEDYAREVARSDLQEPGDEDVFRKISVDLAGRVDEATIRLRMASLLAEARSQLSLEP